MAGLNKKYMRSGCECIVTFVLPKDAAIGAGSVHVLGDFNNWDYYANPMKRQKNGDYKLALKLATGREYRFRYLIDNSIWENDWKADKYVQNKYGSEDSVVVV